MILSWKIFIESVGEIPITNDEAYLKSMSKGANEKVFFLNKIKSDVIVDFGCADGQVLKLIEKTNPNIKLIGYDVSKEMISKARKNVSENVFLTTNWQDVEKQIQNYKTPTLLLSSVIHEVYSYSTSKEVKDFWEKKVFGGYFKYIVIRDMIPSTSMEKKERDLFIEDVNKVKSKFSKEYIESFEKKWGSMEDNYRTFIHFLLKYRYTLNWSRENNENYVPITLETLLRKIPQSYSIKYSKKYTLDILKDRVLKDFDVVVDHSTHLQMIIENLNY